MSKLERLLPPQNTLVEWKSLTAPDADALYGLIRHLEELDGALFRSSCKEVESMLSRPGSSHAIGAYLREDALADLDLPETVEIPNSRLVAYSYVGLARSGKRECIGHGGVHGDWRKRQIGDHLFRWQTAVGDVLLGEAFPGKSARITQSVDDRHTDQHEQLENLGYKWRRSYAELRLNLDERPNDPILPIYLELVPWTEEWQELGRRTFIRASSKMGRDEAQSGQEWDETLVHLVPEWSYVALDKSGDRAKIAGLIAVGRYEQDWDALGWREGYIDLVAVFDPVVRAELLPALVVRALKGLDEYGLDRAAVGLDPQEESEMMAFYTSLGFKPHAWHRTYSLPLGSNRFVAAEED